MIFERQRLLAGFAKCGFYALAVQHQLHPRTLQLCGFIHYRAAQNLAIQIWIAFIAERNRLDGEFHSHVRVMLAVGKIFLHGWSGPPLSRDKCIKPHFAQRSGFTAIFMPRSIRAELNATASLANTWRLHGRFSTFPPRSSLQETELLLGFKN